jgi:hypothetical protein
LAILPTLRKWPLSHHDTKQKGWIENALHERPIGNSLSSPEEQDLLNCSKVEGPYLVARRKENLAVCTFVGALLAAPTPLYGLQKGAHSDDDTPPLVRQGAPTSPCTKRIGPV